MSKLEGEEEYEYPSNLDNYEFDKFSKYEVLAIDLMSDNDWWKPIVEYLGNPTGVIGRKIKYKALSYVVMGNELLKKNHEGLLLKWLGESKAYLEISEVHRRSCKVFKS